MKLPEPLFVQVLSSEHKLTSKKSVPNWHMSIRAAIGEGKQAETVGKIWRPESRPYLPKPGDILQCSAPKDEREEWGNIEIDGFKQIAQDQIPEYAKCIIHGPKASEGEIDAAIKVLNDSSCWEDKKKHKFIMGCISSLDKKKLLACPAASAMHHAFQGGWLVHTAEVVCHSMSILKDSAQYGFIDGDVLLGASILHDAGKIFTYDFDEYGNAISLKQEKTIGHLYYGMQLVYSMAKTPKGEGISPKYIDDVMHCISSHHGRLKHGSMREMQSVEARLLHVADVISSEQGKIHNELQKIVQNCSQVPEKIRIYENDYWVSDKMRDYIKSLKH